jgi:ArsR family transcriptional regulator, arsenate/arsenite/antimonite-responsive transcriptional repressor
MNELITSIKAVSEEIRIRILLLLADKEACVCELMEVFDLIQSKLSHHLITLRDAGLLHDEKRGKWNYYSLNTKTLDDANRELIDYLTRWCGESDVTIKDREMLEKIQQRKQICV